MPNRLRDITGQTYNRLTVLRRAEENTKQGKPRWVCRCICGNIKTVTGSHLKNGSVASCGCLHKDVRGSRHHLWTGVGEISGGWWHKHISVKEKGNRRKGIKIGITKEDAWNKFLEQGRKCALTGIPLIISYRTNENTASLDRIDNSKGYFKNNIQWVHKHINYMKWVHDQDYFIEMCKKVAKHNEF